MSCHSNGKLTKDKKEPERGQGGASREQAKQDTWATEDKLEAQGDEAGNRL